MRPSGNNQEIVKRLLFNLLMIALFFVMIELGARCYHFIKYKDPTVFLYGRKYFAVLADKIRTGMLRGQKESGGGAPPTVDNIFENRNKKNTPLARKEPQKVILQGYPSYINGFGFRNDDIELQKPAGAVRIMMLGDSFVMCVGLDDKFTWERLLSDSLKDRPSRYEIINAAGGGTDINQQLTNLIDKVVQFKPDYVFLFNAHKNSLLLDYKTEYSLGWQISNFFYNISQCYAMVREKSALRTFKDNNYYIYDYRVKITKPEIDKLLGLYRKRLEQFHTVCRENGIDLVLGLRPEFIPSGLKELQHPLDEARLMSMGEKLERQGYLTFYEFEYYTQGLFNMEMKSLAKKRGLLVFDGISAFPIDKYPYFIDQLHLNPKGAPIFAATMHDFIVNKNLVKSR